MYRWLYAAITLILLAGCATTKPGDSTHSGTSGSSGERYAMNKDAYPDLPPDVSGVPDAVPKVEPLSRSGNRSSYEVWGKTYHVLADPKGYTDSGKASWYGEKFHGYATASGEIYDMYKMTAAHRSLPLPTYARVTNIDNNRSVIVKVNDRGPFHGDRLLDLSYAAAARLDILRHGTGNVRVEAIDPVEWQARHNDNRQAEQLSQAPASLPSAVADTAVNVPALSIGTKAPAGAITQKAERLYLQVAALGSASNAQALQARLQSELGRPVRVASDASMHRVQVGPVTDRLALEALRSELLSAGYDQVFMITASE